MKKLFFLSICLVFIYGHELEAQSFYWGPKGGLAIGMQNWNGTNRDPLFGYSGALFIESYREDQGAGSFFGQLGYHTRGSSENVVFINAGGVQSSRSRQRFQFNNLSLLVGAKNRLNTFSDKRPYYAFGLRLEYTISTNLSDYDDALSAGYYPVDVFVNKFNYGATVSFGYEFPFSELVGGFVEANISPDLSRQYAQPQIPGVIDPFTRQSRTLPEQSVRNISIELTVGFRFLRKVIYLEDY